MDSGSRYRSPGMVGSRRSTGGAAQSSADLEKELWKKTGLGVASGSDVLRI